MKFKQTAGRDQLNDFAPQFAALNDDVLFGEIWSDETVSLKTRSIITISIFLGRGLCDSSLISHFQMAKKHGVTKEEIAAVITQGAFYAGWPVAWAAFRLAKEVWTEQESEALSEKDAYAKTLFFPIGEPNDAYAQYFDGQSYLAPINAGDSLLISNVTFEPGCRNHWHIHESQKGGGQMLICVGGRGWYQEKGKAPVEMTPGTIVEIPANVEHWHGAAVDSWFSHLAFEIPGEGCSTKWQDPVSSSDLEVWPVLLQKENND